MLTRLAALASLTLGLSLIVACGDSGSGGSDQGGNGEGASGEGGSSDTEINGCVRSAADDMTGMDEVTLTWTLTHQKCTVVDAGTTVIWDGAFASHPLSGGENPNEESGPITSSDQSGPTASVTFASPGVFPYFCGIHFGQMQGVVYVE